MIVVFVTLLLNNLASKSNGIIIMIYFRFFATGLYSKLLLVGKTDFTAAYVNGYETGTYASKRCNTFECNSLDRITCI